MLAFLIAVIILVVSVVLYRFTDESIVVVGGLFLLGSYSTLIIGCIILCSHVDVDKQIVENQFEYETIIAEVQAVNSDDEDVSKVLVIKDVAAWNKEVQRQKHAASSPWINWCYSQKVVNAMEYIEISEWNIAVPDSSENE